MEQVILIKIQGRTLDNLPKEYTEEQYNQEYTIQEEIVAMEEFRLERNILLDQSDKYSSNDYPHKTDEIKQAWLDYRQALRDLPSITEDPENPNWPTPPK
jgi:hypothetical protein